MVQGLRVPVIPRLKESVIPTIVGTSMVLRSRGTDQSECDQPPKTPTMESAKMYTISMTKLVEECSASRTGVTNGDLERPSMRRLDATRFALSRLSQSSFWLSVRASPSCSVVHQNQIYENGLVKISS